MSEEEDLKEAEEGFSEAGMSKWMVRQYIRTAKAKGAKGGAAFKTLVVMGQVTKLSQLAEKAYYDKHTGEIKKEPDYERSEDLLNRCIRLIDNVATTFPESLTGLFPLKKKIMVQLLDVQYLRQGTVKTPEELTAEVEASLK